MARNFEDLEHDSGDEKLTPKDRAKSRTILSQKKRDKMMKKAPKKGEPDSRGVVRKLFGIKKEPVREDDHFVGLNGRVWDSEDPDED